MGGRALSPTSASGAYYSVAVVPTSSTETTAQEARSCTVASTAGAVGTRPTGEQADGKLKKTSAQPSSAALTQPHPFLRALAGYQEVRAQ